MKTILMLVSVAVLATAAGAEPLGVFERDEQVTLRVGYNDLNLRSAQGRDRLNKRVAAAVRTVCRDGSFGPLAMKRAEQRCTAESFRKANEQVDRALKAQSISVASGPGSVETSRH